MNREKNCWHLPSLYLCLAWPSKLLHSMLFGFIFILIFFLLLISFNHFPSHLCRASTIEERKKMKRIQIENTKNIECHRNMKTFFTIESNVIYASVHLTFHWDAEDEDYGNEGCWHHFSWYRWISIILRFMQFQTLKWYNMKMGEKKNRMK